MICALIEAADLHAPAERRSRRAEDPNLREYEVRAVEGPAQAALTHLAAGHRRWAGSGTHTATTTIEGEDLGRPLIASAAAAGEAYDRGAILASGPASESVRGADGGIADTTRRQILTAANSDIRICRLREAGPQDSTSWDPALTRMLPRQASDACSPGPPGPRVTSGCLNRCTSRSHSWFRLAG